MSHLFYRSKFNGDISQWDTSRVEDMKEMFMGSRFTGDISKWNTSKVEDMRERLTNKLTNWDTRRCR